MCYYGKTMADLARLHILKQNLLLFDFCLFLPTELGRGKRWARNCGRRNFPQIQIKDNSNVTCKLKGEPALVSTLLPLGNTLQCSPAAGGERKPAPGTPASIWCLAYASEHDLF